MNIENSTCAFKLGEEYGGINLRTRTGGRSVVNSTCFSNTGHAEYRTQHARIVKTFFFVLQGVLLLDLQERNQKKILEWAAIFYNICLRII